MLVAWPIWREPGGHDACVCSMGTALPIEQTQLSFPTGEGQIPGDGRERRDVWSFFVPADSGHFGAVLLHPDVLLLHSAPSICSCYQSSPPGSAGSTFPSSRGQE